MSHNAPQRPLRPYGLWLTLAGAVVLSAFALPWDLTHLAAAEGWESAWSRLGTFARGFSDPDLSPRTLQLAASLAGETLAIAVLGVGLGVVLAYPLAILASAGALDDGAAVRGWNAGWRTAVRESFRLLLDALRGIPDFAWALVLLTIFGPNAITAILAIAIHVAGILGKVFSELWDNTPDDHRELLRCTGASRIQVLLYATQPLAGRGMLSFLLMRFECTVRNASVIGAVCGGGLGAAILQELGYDNKERAVTFLATALVLTVGADVLSNTLRGLLRREGSHSLAQARRRRWLAGIGVGAALLLSLYSIRVPISRLGEELGRLDLSYLRNHFGQLLRPDLGAETLWDALHGAMVPVALGVLSTLIAGVLAVGMAWWGSATFQLHAQMFAPEHRPAWIRAARTLAVVTTRLVAAVLRGMPEVIWVWILALYLLTGVEAALGALILHSAGLLARVFTETVDNIPYPRLEAVNAPSRGASFAYGALPLSRADWRTYTLFQFESNVRTGVVLGIVGIGGLGYSFRSALAHGSMGRASTFLLAIVLLTLVIDRISRRIQAGPRC